MTTDNDSVRAEFYEWWDKEQDSLVSPFEIWQASRERYAPRWVSVDDELPTLGDNVLVMMPSGINVGALIDEGEGWLWSIAQYISGNLSESECICDDDYSSITHWMPIPATPNGGNES